MDSDSKLYRVKDVVCDYGIYYGDELICICNSSFKAHLVCKILNYDHFNFMIPHDATILEFYKGEF